MVLVELFARVLEERAVAQLADGNIGVRRRRWPGYRSEPFQLCQRVSICTRREGYSGRT